MRKKLTLLLFGFTFVVSSCTKPEGEGGRNTISGTVNYDRYDHNNKLINTEIAVKERVYIVYGDNANYSDDVDTYLDGKYSFSYLRKGSYQIMAYEDCDTCHSDKKAVIQSAELSKSNSSTEVDLVLRKNVEVDDGFATISGQVFTQQYVGGVATGTPYIDEEQRVYIVYDTDSMHFDRVDTDANGYYRFSNLIMGNYRVYAYSGCETCGINLIPKSASGTISEKGGDLVLNMTIEQH